MSESACSGVTLLKAGGVHLLSVGGRFTGQEVEELGHPGGVRARVAAHRRHQDVAQVLQRGVLYGRKEVRVRDGCHVWN